MEKVDGMEMWLVVLSVATYSGVSVWRHVGVSIFENTERAFHVRDTEGGGI